MLLRRVTKHVKEQNWFAVGVDFLIVVVGVFIGIQVANWNDARSDVRVGDDYLRGLHADLSADAAMLAFEIEARHQQLEDAEVVLEFFDGRALDTNVFFGRYISAIISNNTQPNRNTMQEVLSSGNLRLIREPKIRTGLLELYALYESIALTEAHLARDFDTYLYDTTFSIIPVQFEGPWDDTAANRAAAQALLDNIAVENGLRLILVNLDFNGSGIIANLEVAQHQVFTLLEEIENALDKPRL
ncbi:MAG: hypothetical protein AAF351_01365 [Pseudomonadota bacterium]